MRQHDERPSKRQKTAHNTHENAITNANQIHQLLEFRQSIDNITCKNLAIFKSYLVNVFQLDDGSSEKARQLQTLLEYSQWQKAATDTQLDFHDLLSTWSFAVEQNTNDEILLLVPAVLAQFLKTISSALDLRQYGLALIDTLLHRGQSKLFGKGLAAAKTKPDLSAPCLRLLKQMVDFDGGARAHDIWLRRDLFINRSDALLSSKSLEKNQDEHQSTEPLRPLTITLLLTLIKYLDGTAKAELLAQQAALHLLLQGLVNDDPDSTLHTIRIVDSYLIEDTELPRLVLQRFFNSTHLEYLSALYAYDKKDEPENSKEGVREAVHKLLHKLCTTSIGVLISLSDWYPSASTYTISAYAEADYIDLGLDALNFKHDYAVSVPVKNSSLSDFIQKLRPFQDILQSSLLIDIFKAAPELVAEYFSRRKQIPPPDSDDAAWRGALALLFSIIELPIPTEGFEMHPQNPPPVAIVIENIVPRPLDKSYFQKLMSSSDNIPKITGARLLTTLLRKLENVLSTLSTFSSTRFYLWDQAIEKLRELTQSRIPSIRDITLALQHTSRSSEDLYTAMLECFATYMKVLPNSSTGTTFDISPIIMDLCLHVNNSQLEMSAKETIYAQLGHCVQIAELTSATKWLQKSDADTLSPLGQLVKVMFTEESSQDLQVISQAIERVLVDSGVVSNHRACRALFSSLKPKKKLRHFSPSDEIFLFLDNSIVKASQKPVKYLDEIEDAQQLLSDKKPLSLLVASMCEQWTFVIKKYADNKEVLKNIASFTAQLFLNLETAGENFRVMQYLERNTLHAYDGKVKKYIQDAFQKVGKLSKPTAFEKELIELERSSVAQPQKHSTERKEHVPTLNDFTLPPYRLIQPPTSLESLDRWSPSTDIEVEIKGNQLSRLVFTLGSPDEELRLQSLQSLQTVAHLIDTSSMIFDTQPQIFLLLSELLETTKLLGLTVPIPTIILQLTHQLVHVLIQPESKIYPKANRFLLQAPSWDVKRLMKYWTDKILLREPGADDPSSNAWMAEVDWLVTLLAASIRTEQDLELYRRSGVWERVMSLYVSPALDAQIRKMIIVMLWRVCEIRGGADMLWTRFGVHSWLQQMYVMDAENAEILRALRADLESRCDRAAIENWEMGSALLRDGVAVH